MPMDDIEGEKERSQRQTEHAASRDHRDFDGTHH